VESLFIETAEGERYMLPFKNLTAGKAMLEHVRNGGLPYDLRGQHISEMISELGVLSRFRRANQGKLLEGDTAALVEQTNAYHTTLQRNLKSLTNQRGYTAYFESWSPNEVTEEQVVIEGLKHLFVTQSIDQRVEDALPLLAKIQKQGTEMKEANIFEAWAERLAEGTWQTPDTPEKQTKLIELLSKDLPVGADATNATEQLYDLLGDDQLFDQLEELAERDANADARQVVYDRLQELSNDPDVRKVMDQLQIDPTAEMNPPEATNPVDLEPQQPTVEAVKDPATQTEDPAGTPEPAYPEYAEDLSAILNIAGVPAKERPAPDYEIEVAETLEDDTDIGGDASDELIRDVSVDQQGDINLDEGQTKEAMWRDAERMSLEQFVERYGDEDWVREFWNAIMGPLDEGNIEEQCNMTEAGESCPKHGVEECWGSDASPLAGQYGHSGKLKAVDKDVSFLDRLKELSGLRK
jgi:hypothetical protein